MFKRIFRAIDSLVAACDRLTALLHQCSDRLEESLPESAPEPAVPVPTEDGERKAARRR